MALPREHLLDELATAYVQTVAALGGATIAVSRLEYGIDGTLKEIVRGGDRYIESGFPVDVQLQGTTAASRSSAHVSYDLNSRNYDLIVTREANGVPFYLFLVCFGQDPANWIAEGPDALAIRAAAYFWTDSGAPTPNSRSVRVSIPVANRLTPDAIALMLNQSKERFADD